MHLGGQHRARCQLQPPTVGPATGTEETPSIPTLQARGGSSNGQQHLGGVPVATEVVGHSPAEHEDVVEQGVFGQGDHLLQAELLAAPVEAIGAVHTDVTVIAARAVLHGAQPRRALAGWGK